MRYLAAMLAAVMMVSSVAVAAEVQTAENPAETTAQASAAAESVPEAAEEADWRLLLVNPWNKLPEGYTVELKSLASGLKVDARIYDDLSAMLGACFDAGLHPVVCSAYRSNATQQRLHNNKIARLMAAGYGREAAVQEAGRWVAAPGTSEHQTGMALDIVSYNYQNLTRKQEETAEQKWLMEHCWEYGFILRYPSDKCEITGIGYEPWHYRYVGRDTAMAIRESGLCLEEYLALPKESPAEETAVEQPQEEAYIPIWKRVELQKAQRKAEEAAAAKTAS